MKRPHVDLMINSLAFVTFLFLTTTGVILKFYLPPRSGRTKDLIGMNRHEWGDIHFIIAVTFLTLIIVHLLLHKKWIGHWWSKLFSKPKSA